MLSKTDICLVVSYQLLSNSTKTSECKRRCIIPARNGQSIFTNPEDRKRIFSKGKCWKEFGGDSFQFYSTYISEVIQSWGYYTMCPLCISRSSEKVCGKWNPRRWSCAAWWLLANLALADILLIFHHCRQAPILQNILLYRSQLWAVTIFLQQARYWYYQ